MNMLKSGLSLPSKFLLERSKQNQSDSIFTDMTGKVY